MAEWILNFFSGLSDTQVVLITILVSMIPIIEMKLAIPFGASSAVWGEHALSVWESFLWSYVGCTIIALILIFSFKAILRLLLKLKFTRSIADKITNKLNRHKDDIETSVSNKKSNARLTKALAIGAFVAVPLPLTGVWTGSCLCTILKMPILDSILSVVIGNLVCGIIVTLLSKQLEEYTHILVLVVLGLAVALVLGRFIISKIKKRKSKDVVVSTTDTESLEENAE